MSASLDFFMDAHNLTKIYIHLIDTSTGEGHGSLLQTAKFTFEV